MKDNYNEVVKKLTKKYYLKITTDCIELSPLVKDCFEIRKQIVTNLKNIVDHE